MSNKLKVLDLFSWVWWLSYWFEMAGFDIVWAVEFDESIADSMKKNHKNTKIFVWDIRNISPESVKKEIWNVNVIVWWPPCQWFSLKWQRKWLNDERNFLFKEYIKYIKFFKPDFFVMENVPTILTEENGYFKCEILNEFWQIWYKIETWILNASDFWVPQNRKRAIFIWSLNNNITLPTPKNGKKITVWEAISDLAYLESWEWEFESDYKIDIQSEYQKIMRKWTKKLYNHIATKHSEIALDRLKRIPPEQGKEHLKEKISSTFWQTWWRLEKNKQSPTIVTRFDTPSNGKNSHPFLNRAITPREAARIQSFPDNFIFYWNKSSIIKQIWNAVPPLLWKAIAEHILNNIKKKDKIELNNVYNLDALSLLKEIETKSINLLLTDIPYEKVNKKSNWLRKLDKENANLKTFELKDFLPEIDRITRWSWYIFCWKEQVSEIFEYFDSKWYTTRLMIWEKTNPNPMNCQHVWMSWIETFVYFKKTWATFNEHYKNSVLRFPNWNSKIHPTEKPLKLFKYLIEVSSNKWDIVCDPCVGSWTTALASKELWRNFIVWDINNEYCNLTIKKIKNEI